MRSTLPRGAGEEVEGHRFRRHEATRHRQSDAIEYMIAVRLQDHLPPGAGQGDKQIHQAVLCSRMKLNLGGLHDDKIARLQKFQ